MLKKSLMKKSLLWLSVFVLLLGVLVGCSQQTAKNENQPAQNSSQELALKTTYPLTITDDTGTKVTITKEPTRIISLIPSNTETLFALGLEGKVVAVTKYDNYPKDVQKKVEYVFQDGLNPNVEQIIKLKPDLILLGSLNKKELTAKIRELKIPVLQFDPQSLDAVYQTIEKVGLVTNTQQQAKEVISQMKEKEKSIKEKLAALKPEQKVRVFVAVSPDLYTPGKGTFMDELITKAGGINIVEDQGWVQYNEEKIIKSNPQVILTTYGYYDKNAAANIMKKEGWQNIDAIKNKRVIDLDSDLVNRPGPRIIDGLESIAKALYPDLMK
ncbi:ABC transporter substrate-binding protein [Tepidibacillus fermentans]|uniref:Iron complex transport system substrate-binding protein n=1 Tax=Tepidibacillus fermentans TaxID=1281767 RepID=A0A4R3KAH4_9BACI|nr:ABC transporter substrate-binding protein [Tepidibacillus fermentans]TCS79933.1 iron complex transport system substrate-binding protein [Tepidibacillus fermentans]